MNKKTTVSIVIPCLNEERTIAEAIKNAMEGLSLANVEGEVLIMDSSTDNSSKIANDLGAKVIPTKKKGLGYAYINAIPHIRGEYVVMGDADCTYDFKEIKKFIAKLNEGFEFVIGTRLKGVVEHGAMPALHQYFGTPLTTWILNKLLGTKFSDIHCGLRALTITALKKINIQSESWEYASEMVVKAGLLNLKSAEIPIHFYKDKEGRLSHHKRSGWFSPWHAGWINLKIMLLYAPNQMILKPGVFFLFTGFFLILMQINGPVTVREFTFSTGTMILGLTLAVLGFSSIQMALMVEFFSNINRFFKSKTKNLILKHFTYTKGVLLSISLFLSGTILSSTLIFQWYEQGFKLNLIPWYVICGLLMTIFSIQIFLFSLAYQAFMLKDNICQDTTNVN